jgi:hypothetical protein
VVCSESEAEYVTLKVRSGEVTIRTSVPYDVRLSISNGRNSRVAESDW